MVSADSAFAGLRIGTTRPVRLFGCAAIVRQSLLWDGARSANAVLLSGAGAAAGDAPSSSRRGQLLCRTRLTRRCAAVGVIVGSDATCGTVAPPLFPCFHVKSAGQPLKGQIPVSIQRLADRVRGSSCGRLGSDDGKAAKSARRLTSHWTSSVTNCAK